MKLHDYFADFLTDTVNLSEKRLDTLAGRISAIETAVLADSELGAALGQIIPQGSYAHRTIINPVKGHEYDADVLLPFVEQPGQEPKYYVNELYRLLARISMYAGKITRRSRCVVVDYADPFHVDVVPYVPRAGAAYITNRNTNQFELTNPEGFNEWLDSQNRAANGHLVPVIRLLKYVRDYKQTFSIKSVVLTTLLGGAVTDARTWGDTNYCSDLPTALVSIVTALDNYLRANPIMPTIADPSCPGENFNHRWNQTEYTNFRSQLHRYAEIIVDAFDESDQDRSLVLWRRVFGDEFRKTATLTKALQASTSTRAASDREQDLEADLRIPIRPRYKVKLIGRVQKKPGFRDYSLPTRANHVAKGRDLRFTVDTSTIPGAFEIYWKVKNTGEEAAKVDQLRGQINPGGATHHERTLYKGSHYVEVYVVQNGICVALDRQRVVIA